MSSILGSSVGSTGKIGDSETTIVSVGPVPLTAGVVPLTAVVSSESCVFKSCSSTYKQDGMYASSGIASGSKGNMPVALNPDTTLDFFKDAHHAFLNIFRNWACPTVTPVLFIKV